MIEPRYAARLGFSLCFAQDAKDEVARTVRRLRELGIEHVRIGFGNGDDPAWSAWLVRTLADCFTVCAVVDANGDDAALARLLETHHAWLDSVEILLSEENTSAGGFDHLKARLESIRRAGLACVLSANDAAYLSAALCRIGSALADLVPVFGPQFDLAGTRPSDVSAYVAKLRRDIDLYAPGSPIWLTDIRVPASPHDVLAESASFIDVISSSADRVYWGSIRDARTGSDPVARHAGMNNAWGHARLLDRLLEHGVAEVKSMVALTRRLPSPSIVGHRSVLVTGGAGFIGTNLVDRLAQEGHSVVVYDALARAGVERNVRWLARRHPKKVNFVFGDLRDEAALGEVAGHAACVFHLAGQVAVTTSMVHPLADFEVNARGTISLLEAVRLRNPTAPVIFASTNKVYGDLGDIDLLRDGDCYLPVSEAVRSTGVSEARKLDFHTPYGCSKGAADQYVLDYAHSFGLNTAVLRMSCIYGEHQLGTEDQGWVAHFLLRAKAGETLTIYGDGRQVRDILHVGDAVQAYTSAWDQIEKIRGRAYNLGGGPSNAISLRQLVHYIETLLGHNVGVTFSEWRPGDQRYFVADTSALRRDLGLPDPLNWRKGVGRLAEHLGAVAADNPRKVEALS